MVKLFEEPEIVKIRKYKISRSDGEREYHIWAKDADEAFFRIGREIDPKVVSTQWTGEEREITGAEYDRLVDMQIAGWQMN